ncbi:restriction endonuclease subunit S [Paenibacillus sp. NPDC058910]|uniref:restriction endonuclease subunit S n=1 Tax=unclassified Paenibacillus TaxID=185978 RepID=UPI00369F74E7
MNTPKLRFKEFKDSWSSYKLGEVCTFSKGKELSKADLSKSGEPCILYGELYTRYGTLINSVVSKTNSNSMSLVRAGKNSVLVPSSGETTLDIACASALNIDDVLIGGDLNILIPNCSINGHFLSLQINGKQKVKLSNLAQGATIVHLYSDSIKRLECAFPSLEEQNKISRLFEILEKKVHLQQEKINMLKDLKKGYVQKIFSREIRFKDKNGQEYPEWSLQKLRNFSERVTTKNSDLVTVRPLTISAQYGLIDQIEFFNKTVASENLTGYYLLNKGEFAYNKSYSNGYPLGAIKRLDDYESGALSTLYICFKPKENVNSDFLVHYFDSTQWYKEVSLICVEGARNHGLLNVSVSEFFETLHYLPCLEEQLRIAKFFNCINQKIKLNEQTLENLQGQKQTLMQQMFI